MGPTPNIAPSPFLLEEDTDLRPGRGEFFHSHLCIRDLVPGVQFAVDIYDDRADQCCATWRIRWKFMSSYLYV